jgi:predicted MFS family arabinose efflux permease
MLPVGRFLTIAPPKHVFLASIAVFEIGSLMCALAPSLGVLIAGRAISGCGAAGSVVFSFI